MNFASPDRLAWLLVALPILLFYILRTRLRKQSVATLLFWDQLFDQKRQRSLWQRLRHWLSLLLQLAFLLLIVGALIDPLWKGQRENARQVVIVLDNSASMQAKTGDGATRFDQAKEEAQGVVASLRDGDEIAFVTAGGSVRVVVGMTDFGPAVRDAIDATEVNDGPTRILEATEAARRLTRSGKKRDLVVITDLCFDGAETLTSEPLTSGDATPSSESDDVRPLDPSSDVRIRVVGEAMDNVGITSLAVRRSLVDPIGYAALVKVQNFGEQPAECRLTIDLAGDLVDVIPLDLAPGQQWKKTVIDASASGGVLRAELDISDGLSVDNESIAVLPERPKIPVVLVSEQPSLYLESVLQAIPLVELSTTATPPNESPEGGFTVLHRVIPEELPSGSVLAIDPRSDCDMWTLGDSIQQAMVAKQEASSPLMPHVRLLNVLLPEARELQLNGPATPLLVDAGGSTLMASMIRQEDRIVVLATDLESGDLPLRIAFPVMMTNAVNWFLGRTGELQPSISTGELVQVECRAQQSEPERKQPWAWADSNGHIAPATVTDNFAMVGPIERTGLARLGPRSAVEKANAPQQDGDPPEAELQELAVNLCDASESNLIPRFEPVAEQAASTGSGYRSLWFYLTCLGLGLVVGEWFLYQRRIVG